MLGKILKLTLFNDDLYAPKFKEILARKKQQENPQFPDEPDEH